MHNYPWQRSPASGTTASARVGSPDFACHAICYELRVINFVSEVELRVSGFASSDADHVRPTVCYAQKRLVRVGFSKQTAGSGKPGGRVALERSRSGRFLQQRVLKGHMKSLRGIYQTIWIHSGVF
ncbi:hypothetical protein TNCV_770691 [Trichonephila clavipes]|nr:hypothetical protein TNCV_770691 [Trichonephila clavipes]